MNMKNCEIVQYALGQSEGRAHVWRKGFVKEECLESGMEKNDQVMDGESGDDGDEVACERDESGRDR